MNHKSKTMSKRAFWLALLAILFVYSVVMIRYSKVRSLWYDDIYQIYFSGNGQTFAQVLHNIAKVDLNPPLWACVMKIWLDIAPYGTAWVRLLPELATIIGVIFIALTGRKAMNEHVGLFAAGFTCASYVLISQAAYALRAYGFAFLGSAFVAYRHALREEKGNLYNTLMYALATTLFASFHYFGVFVAVIYAVLDLYGMIAARKTERITFKRLFLKFLPYAISFVIMLPWVYAQFTRVSDSIQTFWATAPFLSDLDDVVLFLLSYDNTLFYLFIFSVLFIGLYSLTNRLVLARLSFAAVPVVMVAGIYFYSAHLNGGSVWVSRYFICIMPQAFLACGVGLYVLWAKLHEFAGATMMRALVLTLFAILAWNSFERLSSYARTVYEPFKEVADGIMAQEDVLDPDTLVYVTTPNGAGWLYYLSENGNRDVEGLNLVDNPTMKYFRNIDYSGYKKIYYFKVHWSEKVTMDYGALEAKLQTTHTAQRMSLPGEVYCYTRK